MATNIQLLRSSIEQKRPAASVLLDGQVALNINYKEPGLFFRLTNGQLAKVGPVAYTNDGLAPNSSAAGEPGNSVGELWFDDRISYDNGITKLWDGAKWTTTSGFTVDNATGDLSLDRDLEVNILRADTIQLTDELILSNNMLPDNNCQWNIGHDLARFQTGYFCTVDSSGSIYATQDVVGQNGVFGNEVLTQDLRVSRDTILGTTLSDRLTVNAQSTFESFAQFNADTHIFGNTVIGQALPAPCALSLNVHSTSFFHCPVTFKDLVTFDVQPSIPSLEDLLLIGDTVIGDGCGTSTLVIEAATTVKCDTKFEESVELGKTVLPSTDNTVDLGSPTQRFANIYTGDLHLKNDRGDWTMVEEDDYLTLRNNKTGKTFRLLMEEV